MSNLLEHFSSLPDPRVKGRTDYPLIEIIFLCICAIISGFDGWEAIEDFGQAQLEWLRKFLPYENGIPRHDTVARVMSCLSPKAMQKSFIGWIQSIAKITEGEIVAIDGKTVRRSYDKKNRKGAIHMVSAWACKNGVVLGQQKTEEKSNEITAIPELLKILELKGSIVTIDAMGCQREIAKTIRENEADYILALKENQGTLHEMVSDFFETAEEKSFSCVEHSHAEETDYGHGRIETRTCDAAEIPKYLKEFQAEWAGLKTIIRINAMREINNVISTETRYYISSLEADAVKISQVIRSHWQIENSLHWILDVTFKEDDSRIRRGLAAENMSVMRHIALNLLKKEEQTQFSVPRKRRKANLHNDYREKLLGI